ncbi:hypothetical protein APHAL10511_008362 [Amanita phalloides]|nr:hypothetical protein APHAL10511_008362 [Amanita phalloides]
MADIFDNLPRTVQNRIDRAFDAVATPSDAPTGGGFLIDDAPSCIPLSLISDALLRLELPPDDDQILSVFRNAASGWSSATNRIDDHHVPSGGQVTRDDWRSVCAVLLEHHAEDRLDTGSEGSAEEVVDLDGSSSDFYASSDAEGTLADSDYEGDATARVRVPCTRRSGEGNLVSNTAEKYTLTKKQQEMCFDAFSLFFPSVPLEDVPNKKIMIKDIQRVAGLLGEKLTADEMVEMLAVFSSSPDKTVSLADFGRIMVAAKLI